MSKLFVTIKCICHVSVTHLSNKLAPLLCSLKLFLSFFWHVGWLAGCSGALLMLVLAPCYMSKLSFCHSRHLNLKKRCKYFGSRYVLARWQSTRAFVVQQEETESSECIDGRVKCIYAQKEKHRYGHTHKWMCVWYISRILNNGGVCKKENFRKYNLMQTG